jgi:hypothetical protein
MIAASGQASAPSALHDPERRSRVRTAGQPQLRVASHSRRCTPSRVGYVTWIAYVVKRPAMRQHDRQRRREHRTGRHVRRHHHVDADHDVVADMNGSQDAPSRGHVHPVPQSRRPSLISPAARDEGVAPQIAFRPHDIARPDNDPSKMGDVEARTNVGRRLDRDTRQNLDRPSSQLVEEPTPPSFQSPLLVRPMREPVLRGGKDPRLCCQDDPNERRLYLRLV